jgi:exonuclease SbcC
MIEFIELRNWKTHNNTRLTFTKGTNVLVGQMGSGKSSVMDAISYALFGMFPLLQHRRISTADIIKNIPAQEQEAEVKLSFNIGADNYVVDRKIAFNGSASATLLKNGFLVQSQPQRVNEFITDVLKLDYDLFSKAIYSEQNGLDYFLELRSGERKDQIDQLLGLDKFALAEDNAGSLANRIKSIVQEQEAVIGSFDIEKMDAQINAAKNELEKLVIEFKSLKNDLDKSRTLLSEKEKQAKELNEMNAKKISLEKEVQGFESKLAIIKREANRIESSGIGNLEDLEKKIKSLEIEIKSAKELEQQLEEKERHGNRLAAKVEGDLKKVKEDIEERQKLEKLLAGKSIDEYNSKIEKKTIELEALEKAFAGYASMKEEAEKYMEELKEHISKCPVCERELSEELRLKLLESKKESAKAAEEHLEQAKKEVEKLRNEIKALKNELDKIAMFSEKLKDYVGLDAKLEESTKELERIDAENQKVKDDRLKAQKMLEELNAENSRLDSNRKELLKLLEYKKEADEVDKALRDKKSSLAGIKITNDIIEKAQKELAEVNSQVSTLNANIIANEKAQEEKKKQIKEKEEEVGHVKDLINDISHKKDVAEGLVKFKNTITETQAILRTKLIDSINRIMSEIWPELYPYGDYVDIKLEPSATDYLLRVKIIRNNEEQWRNVESIASGGERSIACLAMRVAFALVLVPNLKWLILDEPTHNIDQQGISKFIHVFNDTLPKIVEQVFIITHDEVLKQAASSKVYMFTRNKEAHEGTVVEEL